jgi:hypothetical protein
MVYWVPMEFQDKGNPTMIWIGPTLTGGCDGLPQVQRVLDSILGVLASCNSDDQAKHSRGTHSLTSQQTNDD